jgi:hypothetical protein
MISSKPFLDDFRISDDLGVMCNHDEQGGRYAGSGRIRYSWKPHCI